MPTAKDSRTSIVRLNSILLSHFILDLRSIYSKNRDITEPSSTTLHFVANIEGNIGATLFTSRFTGRERDEEDEEGISYSDHPFATGLLESGTDNEVESAEYRSQR